MSGGILIVGAGGHAKVVADILLRQGRTVVGFVDDNPALIGQLVLGLPVLGWIADWSTFAPDALVMGIGTNAVRQQLVAQLEAGTPGLVWTTAVHPSATIASSARLGTGTVVMAGAVINADTMVGNHAIVNTTASIDHDCLIGDFAHTAPGAHLAGGVQVGAGTLIGTGASVIPGVRIGSQAVIGAGAAVVRDVPDHAVAKGVPARWRV